MTFDPARPRYTLPFAGNDYDLLGTFALIEAVEAALKRGVGTTTVEVVREMSAYDLSLLVSTLLTVSGHPTTVKEAGDAIWNEVGLTGEEASKLRLHLYAFLSICLAPPKDREAKATEMGELLGKLDRASPSESGSDSASAA